MIKINLTMPMNPRMFQISPPRIKINLEKLIRLGEVVVVMEKIKIVNLGTSMIEHHLRTRRKIRGNKQLITYNLLLKRNLGEC